MGEAFLLRYVTIPYKYPHMPITAIIRLAILLALLSQDIIFSFAKNYYLKNVNECSCKL
jgi:hypothetical protein